MKRHTSSMKDKRPVMNRLKINYDIKEFPLGKNGLQETRVNNLDARAKRQHFNMNLI